MHGKHGIKHPRKTKAVAERSFGIPAGSFETGRTTTLT
jgi:hypothetical protein